MFVRNQWYIAAFRRDVSTIPTRRVMLGEPVVLYRTPNGAAVALEDRCVHREAPLSMGTVLPSGALQCLYHGMQFDQAGVCVHIPEQSSIPARAREVLSRHRGRRVGMGVDGRSRAGRSGARA